MLLLTAACQDAPAPVPEKTTTEAEQLARDGLALMARQDHDAAAAAFVNARAAARNEPWGRLGMAAGALAAGDLPTARSLLQELRDDGLDPAAAAPYLTAVIDSMQAVPAAAPATTPTPTKEAKPAPTRSPEDRELVELFRAGHYRGVTQRIGRDDAPSLFRLRLMGDAYYNLQQWQDAVTAYRRVLAGDPTDQAVTQYIADALYRLQRYDDSMRMYRILAEANPTRPGFYKLIGDVASAKGDDEVALAAYQKARDRGFSKPGLDEAITRLSETLSKRR